MKNRYMTFVLAIMVMAILLPVSVFSKEIVTWMIYDAPPFYIISGDYKGQGRGDNIMGFLQNHMVEYEHRIQSLPIVRIENAARNGEKICVVEFSKTAPREKFMYYSMPVGLGSPLGILIKRSKKHEFEPLDTLSLRTLLADKKKVLGISQGRSYGEGFSEILRENRGNPNIYVRPGEAIYLGLFKMLLLDRFDYILSYPEEAMFAAATQNIDSEDIMYIPLDGGIYNTDMLSYIATSNTEWGRHFIQKVNAILREARKTDAYRGFFEKWLDKESIPNFREVYETMFLTTEE